MHTTDASLIEAHSMVIIRLYALVDISTGSCIHVLVRITPCHNLMQKLKFVL